MTTTTLALCVKITRRDATVEGYTSHDQDLTISAQDYLSAVGFIPTSVDRTSDLSSDNQQVIGIIDSVELKAEDLRAGVYDGARCEVFMVDWTNEAGGAVATLLVGFLGPVTIEDNEYSVTLNSLESELEKPLLRMVSLNCDAELGDSRCGFTLTGDTGSVTAITTQRRVFTDTSLTAADGFYDEGYLIWTSGPNQYDSKKFDVKKYTASTDTVELYEPLPNDITAAETFTIFAGCNKTEADCKVFGRFDTGFRGKPYIPGVSDIVSGQTQTN